MANSTSDGERTVTPQSMRKNVTPVVQVKAEAAFDIGAYDLLKGYFLCPSFLGSMLAAGRWPLALL